MCLDKVERWDMYEVAFNTSRSYANPFQDIELKVYFTDEKGKTTTVDGFYDGGPVWRVRFMPTQLGKWNYITQSNDPALDRKEGAITCAPPTKHFLHGPPRADGFHFIHADGTRK